MHAIYIAENFINLSLKINFDESKFHDEKFKKRERLEDRIYL